MPCALAPAASASCIAQPWKSRGLVQTRSSIAVHARRPTKRRPRNTGTTGKTPNPRLAGRLFSECIAGSCRTSCAGFAETLPPAWAGESDIDKILALGPNPVLEDSELKSNLGDAPEAMLQVPPVEVNLELKELMPILRQHRGPREISRRHCLVFFF